MEHFFPQIQVKTNKKKVFTKSGANFFPEFKWTPTLRCTPESNYRGECRCRPYSNYWGEYSQIVGGIQPNYWGDISPPDFSTPGRMPQERLPKQALRAKANERRPVGRPRTRGTDYIEDLGWNRLRLHQAK